MSERVALRRSGLVSRLAIVACAAAFLGGCSADAMRLDAFTNPFSSSSRVSDATGSVQSGAASAARTAAPVIQQGNFAAPATPSPRLAQSSSVPTVSTGAVTGSAAGWTATGGTPIVLAKGETLNTISGRYGVPVSALVAANGFGSAAEAQPGSRIIVPVYNAAAGRAAAPAIARAPVSPAVAATAASGAQAAPRLAAKPEAVKSDAEVDRRVAEAKAAKERADADRQRLAKAREDARQAQARLDEEKRRVAASESKPRNDAKAKVEDKAKAEKLARAEAEKAKAAKAKTEKTAREETSSVAKSAPGKSLPGKSAPAKTAAAQPAAQAVAPKVEKKTAEAKVIEPKPVKPEAPVKPEPTKSAKVEKPVAESKKAADPTTTASLPPAEPEKPVTDANGAPEFRWPARGRVIQGFKANGNDGINIALPEGTSVKAAEGGVVAYAGSELKGYGNLVLIRHPNGFVSAYAHNGEVAVKRGEQVKRGQTIAKSGQSGNVATPQLHFELRKGSTPVDPTQYLAGL